MNQYWIEFITVATLHLLAVISPGPDFVMITRNSLVYSRKTGVYSALGLGLGILVHITYSLAGIAYIISKSIVIFSILKLLGAVYLIYIGYKSLRARPPLETENKEIIEQADLTKPAAIKVGFFTNALNPKVTLFFLALFTQVIHIDTPLGIKILYGLEMSFVTFAWFALVATILSHKKIKAPFRKIQYYVERSMGLILIALGIKVAISKR